jgi:predicted nuclease of restriction endonuclease-like (RecB) superfamily
MALHKTKKNNSGQLVPISSIQTNLIQDIRTLIEAARANVAVAVNAELTLLYWNIGRRLHDEILKGKRAEYGKQIVSALAGQLTLEYGKGWGERQLRYCLNIADVFPHKKILHTLCAELSWSHFKLLVLIDDPVKRDFYIALSRKEKWSSRRLGERIGSMLFERTAISKKPEKTIAQDLKTLREKGEVSSDLVFRDSYFLDFLGLSDSYYENDLESAIIVELQRFIIELGQDFAFLARQKRITIDNREYYIDLLFYHRRLKCLVAIDLKIGDFDAAFKGQMELYLRYLEKYDTVEGENPPVGLILCTGKTQEHVELLQLHKSNIRVAEYLTQLPPKKILRAKLHKAIEIARNRLTLEASK